MFVRFRQVRARLNVSLVEAVRVGAKVRQSHLASLGSVPVPQSPSDRPRFWIKLDHRLAALGNRIDEETRETIIAAIHARIPMPTREDAEAAKNAGREANAALFSILRDKHRALDDAHRHEAERQNTIAGAIDG